MRLFNMSWHSAEVPSHLEEGSHYPHPEGREGPAGRLQLSPHLADQPHRQAAGANGGSQSHAPAGPQQHHPGRAGWLQEGSIDRGEPRTPDPGSLGRMEPASRREATRSTAIQPPDTFSRPSTSLRAYDVIDHQMLRLKMLQCLPRCITSWIYHFLRDRRACAEVNGVRSSSRPFRAGPPPGIDARPDHLRPVVGRPGGRAAEGPRNLSLHVCRQTPRPCAPAPPSSRPGTVHREPRM